MKPFLKWAGGKRWLASRFPEIFAGEYRRYVEPFLGSGAIFFHVAPEKSVLSDQNSGLINLYSCIKDNWRKVDALLRAHAARHSADHYYEVRSSDPSGRFNQAARFLYLNRTCWNGLYRENLKGEFNVPKGTKDSVLFPDDDFHDIAVRLANAKLSSCDFATTLSSTRDRDLVFIDPPYTVKHNNNGFLKYNEKIFSWADQERLSKILKAKANNGATFIITNAYHDSVLDLYSGFSSIRRVSRASVLSGKSEFRGETDEALILIGNLDQLRAQELLQQPKRTRPRVGRVA